MKLDRSSRRARGAAALVRFAFLGLVFGAGALVAQERVTLKAADGQPLVGTFTAPREKATGGVLFLPARGGRRVAFDPLVLRLRNSGLALLTLDPRGHGDSAVDAAGKPIELGKGAPADPARSPFALAGGDIAAGWDFLVEKGAPAERLAVVAAGVSAATVLRAAAASPRRPKAAVFLTPDAEESGLDLASAAPAFGARAALLLSNKEDRVRGLDALVGVLDREETEVREFAGPLARGAAILGAEPGTEAWLAQWLQDRLAAPWPLEIPASATVVIDGEPTLGEGEGGALVEIPFEGGKSATVRVTRGTRTIDFAFTVPERYLRLNEVVVFVDGSGAGPRTPDASCYRVSFCPKNPARKPILVQKGGLKGFEDSDDKGVVALARLEDKSRWTAEVSLELDRFCGGAAPRTVRLAFQANGQKADQIRSWPPVGSLATAPRAWARARLR